MATCHFPVIFVYIGHYTLLYGGIVALNIRNVTIKDPDVLEAVKVSS